MDDKDFSIDDILNDVNSKKNSDKDAIDNLDISFGADKLPQKNDYSEKSIDELLSMDMKKDSVLDSEVDEIVKASEDVHNSGEEQATDTQPEEIDEKSEKAAALMGLDELGKDNDVKTELPKTAAPLMKSTVEDEEDFDEITPPKPVKKAAPKKKKKKKKSKFNGSIFGGVILVTIILTVSMILAVGGITLGMEYWGIGKSDNDISFNIPTGSSNEDIADLLSENGIIKNKKLFLLALKIEKPATIFPGDITLQPSMGYSAVIEKIATMRESYKTVTVTFTEGETLLEVATKLEENGVCAAADFLFEFNKDQGYDFEKKITGNDDAFYAREGYFFPDTYEFYVGDTAYNVTKIIREHFESQLTEKMYNRMDKLGLDLNEVMTLASIVQLEAANADEMPNVASVFLNRLDDPDIFPMLQSDTTSKYIKNVIKTQADNDASIDHYTECYDTYQCVGLPAGPICNPGIEAIKAVLYPSDTKYYYFCNNLETGETFYAETLEEHEANLVEAGLA